MRVTCPLTKLNLNKILLVSWQVFQFISPENQFSIDKIVLKPTPSDVLRLYAKYSHQYDTTV